jgi:hypothetical protein
LWRFAPPRPGRDPGHSPRLRGEKLANARLPLNKRLIDFSSPVYGGGGCARQNASSRKGEALSGTHAVRVTLRNGFRIRACGAPRNDEAKGDKNPLRPTAAKNNPYLDFSPESDSLSTRIEGELIDRAAFQAFPSVIGRHRDLALTGQINGNRSFRWPLCQSSRALEGSGPDGLKPERKGTGPENRPVKGSNRRHGTETGPATGKDRKRKIPPRRRPPLSSKEGRDGRLVYGQTGGLRPGCFQLARPSSPSSSAFSAARCSCRASG